MKTNFLLPMIAMIFGVGMSFANIDKVDDPTTDYILQDGVFRSINMEVDCGQGELQCQVRNRNGVVYDLYDAPNNPKKGSGGVIQL